MKILNLHERMSVVDNSTALRHAAQDLQTAVGAGDWESAKERIVDAKRHLTHIENSFRKHLQEEK